MSALFCTVCAVALVSCGGSQKTSVELSYSVDAVVGYISSSFGVDMTELVDHSRELWGPQFLNTNELYWVTTEVYEEGKSLEFTAFYYQIGGETVRFEIEAIDPGSTRITVDRSLKMFISHPGCTSGEKRILDVIQNAVEARGQGAAGEREG